MSDNEPTTNPSSVPANGIPYDLLRYIYSLAPKTSYPRLSLVNKFFHGLRNFSDPIADIFKAFFNKHFQQNPLIDSANFSAEVNKHFHELFKGYLIAKAQGKNFAIKDWLQQHPEFIDSLFAITKIPANINLDEIRQRQNAFMQSSYTGDTYDDYLIASQGHLPTNSMPIFADSDDEDMSSVTGIPQETLRLLLSANSAYANDDAQQFVNLLSAVEEKLAIEINNFRNEYKNLHNLRATPASQFFDPAKDCEFTLKVCINSAAKVLEKLCFETNFDFLSPACFMHIARAIHDPQGEKIRQAMVKLQLPNSSPTQPYLEYRDDFNTLILYSLRRCLNILFRLTINNQVNSKAMIDIVRDILNELINQNNLALIKLDSIVIKEQGNSGFNIELTFSDQEKAEQAKNQCEELGLNFQQDQSTLSLQDIEPAEIILCYQKFVELNEQNKLEQQRSPAIKFSL